MFRFRALSFWMYAAGMALVTALSATPAQAQVAPGVQGGMSLEPDQIYFGGHVETTPLVDRLRFRPNVDIGIGDDVTVVGVNFDFTYTFPTRGPWSLYAGAGPTLSWVDTDRGSDTDGGFNFLIGAKQSSGMFFELKIGMEGSPDLKFGVGYTFR